MGGELIALKPIHYFLMFERPKGSKLRLSSPAPFGANILRM